MGPTLVLLTHPSLVLTEKGGLSLKLGSHTLTHSSETKMLQKPSWARLELGSKAVSVNLLDM